MDSSPAKNMRVLLLALTRGTMVAGGNRTRVSSNYSDTKSTHTIIHGLVAELAIEIPTNYSVGIWVRERF